MSHHTNNTRPQAAPRLPCRGCLPDCPNYATCDGKPWRADKAAGAQKSQPGSGA
ncbi:hypothetical protein [Marinobacter confluentis]|uniref:hypothetical protein n=1 Tax=Marinobacter confluentis TaxID=1697557 RepID=UPI001B2FE6A9|nr:hypothetical protein [Marinobacter confluentis]